LPAGLGCWPVAIDGPRGSVTVPLARGALATSGIGRRRWRRGASERHHLLDPRSGRPAWTGLWSVTAVAGTCAQAELAAKVAFVLGRGPGTEFLRGQAPAGQDGGGGMLTWIVARAAGFTAYGLLTGSVVLGLALGPRWATTELHRFVTLLTLVFLGLHVVALALDGYLRFGLVELLVPFANRYRPLWIGLGVVAAWLALAVWASSWLQGRIGLPGLAPPALRHLRGLRGRDPPRPAGRLRRPHALGPGPVRGQRPHRRRPDRGPPRRPPPAGGQAGQAPGTLPPSEV